MKKQVQSTGERDWFGDDILLIQNEVWSFLENLLSQYNNACIVSGCKVTAHSGGNWDVSAGVILVQDASNVWQFCRFAGASNVSLPQYLVPVKTDANALYYDSVSKPILSSYDATLSPTLPDAGGYLQLASTGAATWLDVIQSSSKRFVSDADIAAWNAAASIKPGFMMLQAMAVVPTGWMECDGTAISRSTYAGLFSAIGVLYGAGDGSTTFNIPDMRGLFARGYDHGKAIDPSRVLGSDQADDLKAHGHQVPIPKDLTNGDGGGAGPFLTTGNAEENVADGPTLTASSTGGTETRPKNKALLYIIKY